MKKFLIAAAALAVPGAAFAADAPPAAAFDYKATLTEKEIVVLQGEEAATGRHFKLKVFSDGAVAGRFGENRVRYNVERSMRDRLVEKLRQQAVTSDATARIGS